jgi:hypothetical protein
MVTLILSIFVILLYLIGGFFATMFVGWELQKTKDLFKMIFWVIFIWFEK